MLKVCGGSGWTGTLCPFPWVLLWTRNGSKKIKYIKKKSYEATGNLDIVEVTFPEVPQLESDGAEGRADMDTLSCSKTSSFFLNKFIHFNWRLLILQYCGGFCHTLTWTSHGCTCVPHPETPSHRPPHPIPLGFPSAPALSVLFHASNLDWWSISHMVIFMFQCYSLKSSHHCLLPQSPKVCFYICISFAVSYIGSSLPSF